MRKNKKASPTICKEPVSLPHPRDFNIERVTPTPIFDGYSKLFDLKIYNRSIFVNSRKAILGNMRANKLKPNDTDLYKVLQLAFEKHDNEFVETILSLYPPRIHSKGPLFDLIFDKYIESIETPLWKSIFQTQPYSKLIKDSLRNALSYHSVVLDFSQKEKLLRIAVQQNDYSFAHDILSSPHLKAKPKRKRNKAKNEDPNKATPRNRNEKLFDIFKDKITEYYASYKNDKHSLFRLVALKQVLKNDDSINYNRIKIRDINPLIERALLHGNIQFVEMWLIKKPQILKDKSFRKVIHKKYVDCVREMLLDSDSRSGYGIGTITAILDSKVLAEDGLDDLKLSKRQLQEIYSDIAPQWRDALKSKLKKFGIIFTVPKSLVHDTSSEQWAIKCLNGRLDEIKAMVSSGVVDLSKIRYKNQTLLYYAASYNRGDEANNSWPYSALQLPINLQKQDPHFQDLSANKNKILGLLLRQYEFNKEDIQAAFNSAYQDGIVKREKPKVFGKSVVNDQNLETKYALRGDHGILKQLIEAGADLSIGKSFMGIYKAITISYVSALSLDFILGVSTELIQEYLKVPVNRWYQSFAPWVSASSSAYTFEKTGVVIEYYHRTLNPDYLSNNLLDLSDVIVAGTNTRNWYGKVITGKGLQNKMEGKTGITGAEGAIFDVDDITHRNLSKHWNIAHRVYEEYKIALQKNSNKKLFKKFRNYNGLIKGLEEINKKCVYGVPGDNHYSFNNAFQQKLRDLLNSSDHENLINSIIIYEKNRLFFLDFAKGVDQGLIKVPLEIKQKVQDLNQEISQRIVQPKQCAPQRHLHMMFGSLVGIYASHTKNRIPLSVLLVAQTFEQRRISGIDVHHSYRQRAWCGIVHGYDSMLGAIAPRFGITKERGHELVAQTASATISFSVGAANYYEKKIRTEIIEKGVLISSASFTALAASTMMAIKTIGISPIWVVPPLAAFMAFMYCKHHDIHPTETFKKMYKAFKEATIERPDRQGVFINKKTMDSFKKLFSSYKIDSVPEVVHCSL